MLPQDRLRPLLLVLFALALLAAGAAPSVRAQSADDVYRFGTRLPAIGTRAMGMGGAGVAGRSDPSAPYTNPAGLGYYSTSAVSGGLNLLLSRDESTFQIFADGPSSRQTGESSSVQLGSVTGVYNVPTTQGSLVFALGYNRMARFDRSLRYEGVNSASSITDTFLPSDVDDEYEITSERINIFPVIPFVAFQAGAIEFFESRFQNGEYPFLQAVAPGRRIRQEGTVGRDGTMNEWTLAGAVEAAPNFLLGGSLNITSGEYAFEHELTETDLEGEDNYSVATGSTLLEDFERLFFRTRFTSEFTGVNLRGGFSTTPVDNVRFGVTVETPTWQSVSETFTDAFIRTTFANGSLTYGDDADEDEARGQFEYRLTTPWRFGVGLSYNSPPLLVTADVEFVDWSQAQLSADGSPFVIEQTNDTLEEQYGYVANWRGGAEYRFDNGLRLRAGAAYRPDARDFDVVFADGDREDRSRLFFSSGIGFAVNDQLSIDLAWMQERTNDQFVPYSSVTPPTEEESIAVPFVDETVVRNQIQVGMSYSF